MSAIITFGAALFVALLCLPFSRGQISRLIAALPRLEIAQGESAQMRDDLLIARSYIAQSLEVAYGFPAAILTLIAFGDLFGWSPIASAILIAAAVLATIAFVLLRNLEHENTRLFLKLRIGQMSIVSLTIVLANVVGLAIAIIDVGQQPA